MIYADQPYFGFESAFYFYNANVAHAGGSALHKK